jgi:hypothetical protein
VGGHSFGHSKKKNIYIYKCLTPNCFRPRIIHCTAPKLLVRKRYYVLFLTAVFIVQVTKLVEFI